MSADMFTRIHHNTSSALMLNHANLLIANEFLMVKYTVFVVNSNQFLVGYISMLD